MNRKITKESLYITYTSVVEKMAKYPELFGTEQEVGILIPIGCKRGIQVVLKAVRVKKQKNKYVYGL